MALDWNWERAQIGVGSFNVTKRKLSTMDGWVLVRKMVLRLKSHLVFCLFLAIIPAVIS